MKLNDVLEKRIQQSSQGHSKKSNAPSADLYVSKKLQEMRATNEERINQLVLDYLDRPKEIAAKLVKRDSFFLGALMVALSGDFPDAITKLAFSKAGASNNPYKDDLEKKLRQNLVDAISLNLTLASTGNHGYAVAYKFSKNDYRNPVYRSLCLYFKTLARVQKKLVGAFTIVLSKELMDEPFTTKTQVRVKNKLRRILESVLGQDEKAAAYTIEYAKTAEYHMHGLVLYPREKEQELRLELRRIASNQRNSVVIKTGRSYQRIMSLKEGHASQLTGNQARVWDYSGITVGYADYCSKDLGKTLNGSDITSSIITISSKSYPPVGIAPYVNARKELISICAKKVRNEITLIGHDEFARGIEEQVPIYRALRSLMLQQQD
ncbi:hypothetical protein [Idiomarina abyssalis]|uniref:hypothetical protein n=1 Tax=Idiomarina abyssalis TaxID=86102 RepID=UPI003A8F06E0